MKNILNIFTLTWLLTSCNSQQDTGKNKQTVEVKAKIPDTNQVTPSINENIRKEYNFLDSVKNKLDLTVNQIRQHTLLDSIYYNGMFSEASFSGDTVVAFYRHIKGAIINYDDRKSCKYKFLFIFDSTHQKSTFNKIVYSECDRDESADYTSINFRIMNDSTIEIAENYIKANSRSAKPSTKKTFYKINTEGIIESTN